MSDVTEYIYLGKDNSIGRVLKEDGVAVNLSNVTKMEMIFGTTVILSTDAGEGSGQAFDWTQGSGKLELKLGGQAIPVGEYQARLVVYDITNTDGIVWDEFPVEVVVAT